jgi:hypothetical protein
LIVKTNKNENKPIKKKKPEIIIPFNEDFNPEEFKSEKYFNNLKDFLIKESRRIKNTKNRRKTIHIHDSFLSNLSKIS